MIPFFSTAVGVTQANPATDNPEAILLPEEDALYDCLEVMSAALRECDVGPLDAETAEEYEIRIEPLKLAAGIETPREIVSECFTGLNARMMQTRYAREGLISSIIEGIKKFFARILEFFSFGSAKKSAEKRLDEFEAMVKETYGPDSASAQYLKMLTEDANKHTESPATAGEALLKELRGTRFSDIGDFLEKRANAEPGNEARYKHLKAAYEVAHKALVVYLSRISPELANQIISAPDVLNAKFAEHAFAPVKSIEDFTKKLPPYVTRMVKLLKSCNAMVSILDPGSSVITEIRDPRMPLRPKFLRQMPYQKAFTWTCFQRY